MLGARDFPLGDPYASIRNILRLPPNKRKTFVWDTPSGTHYRTVTCAEAASVGECSKYANGFALPMLPTQSIEDYESRLTASGYVFQRGDTPAHLTEQFPAGTRWLVFPPEQRCLESFKVPHRVSLDHDPFLSIEGGDFRAFTGDTQRFSKVDDWVDALHTTTDRLNHEIEKG